MNMFTKSRVQKKKQKHKQLPPPLCEQIIRKRLCFHCSHILHRLIGVNIYFCFIDFAKACDCVDHNKLWKILKEMGIPDHLTCLLRSLYAGQEATVRTEHGTTDWFQIGKRVHQDCILSPCLFNLHAEYIMRNTGLEEAQAGIKDCQEKHQ